MEVLHGFKTQSVITQYLRDEVGMAAQRVLQFLQKGEIASLTGSQALLVLKDAR